MLTNRAQRCLTSVIGRDGDCTSPGSWRTSYPAVRTKNVSRRFYGQFVSSTYTARCDVLRPRGEIGPCSAQPLIYTIVHGYLLIILYTLIKVRVFFLNSQIPWALKLILLFNRKILIIILFSQLSLFDYNYMKNVIIIINYKFKKIFFIHF